MTARKPLSDVCVQPDYRTWLDDVGSVLASMDTDMDAWQENWTFDFQKEYDRGSTPHDAALHAHDFWWQQLLAECWT